MSQRRKIADAARLTVVQTSKAAADVTETAPVVPGQVESRGPLPPRPDVGADKGAGVGSLKANRKRILVGAAAALLLAAAGWLGWGYMTTGRFMVSTDDAYVRANNTTLGAKVSGYVSELLVEENTKVHAGDVIARIDDGDYRLAVDTARDKVATQEATIARFDRQIDAVGQGGADADGARIRAPAGLGRQAIRQQTDPRTIDRQPRPG